MVDTIQGRINTPTRAAERQLIMPYAARLYTADSYRNGSNLQILISASSIVDGLLRQLTGQNSHVQPTYLSRRLTGKQNRTR